MPLLTADELNTFLAEAFDGVRPYEVTEVGPDRCRVVMDVAGVAIRPGGTVSGPTLMMLADAAAYAVVLAHIGRVALAVTSNLTITFLRKAPRAGLVAEAELLKLGRRLAVADVRLRSAAAPALVAQATVTYAIPRG